jgi:glycosyltransferase involved in cell wall biosynthesis
MALIEAMACGIPIITTNTGAIPEVVGSAAILCDPEYDSIRSELMELINSPAKINKYSKLSLSRARSRYDHKLLSKKLFKLYS